MGNRLFQEARRSVNNAKMAGNNNQQESILQAKNALSSAFANSTAAEQMQLQEMQQELDQITSSSNQTLG